MAAGEDKGEDGEKGAVQIKGAGTFFPRGNCSARLPSEQGKQSTGASRDTRGPRKNASYVLGSSCSCASWPSFPFTVLKQAMNKVPFEFVASPGKFSSFLERGTRQFECI